MLSVQAIDLTQGTKTLVASGKGEFVIGFYQENSQNTPQQGFAIGDNSPFLGAGILDPGIYFLIGQCPSQNVSLRLKAGDKLYAWPLSGQLTTVQIMKVT